MLERNGLRIAAVSYDSPEVLQAFAEKHGIGFPLLSDRDSAVIRSFGIFNTNIAPGLRAHGVPHPVDYLVAPDGTLIRKYFVPNYQHRVTASAVVLREFGAIGEGARVSNSAERRAHCRNWIFWRKGICGPGDRLLCELQAGARMARVWHTSSNAYTAISIAFDDPGIARQSFDLPEARPMKIDASMKRSPFTVVRSGGWVVVAQISVRSGPHRVAGQTPFSTVQRHRLRGA